MLIHLDSISFNLLTDNGTVRPGTLFLKISQYISVSWCILTRPWFRSDLSYFLWNVEVMLVCFLLHFVHVYTSVYLLYNIYVNQLTPPYCLQKGVCLCYWSWIYQIEPLGISSLISKWNYLALCLSEVLTLKSWKMTWIASVFGCNYQVTAKQPPSLSPQSIGYAATSSC